MSAKSYKITFVGAGRMASAIIRSLLNSQSYAPGDIACCSAKDGTAEALSAATGIHIVDPETNGCFKTNTLVLACKPQQLNTLSETIIESARDTLLISILAGTRIEKLNSKFPGARNIVRVMPNTPGSIGEGMSGYSFSAELLDADKQIVENLLESLGKYVAIDETEMDELTSISGSGPAYLFLFAEALRDAGIAQGFSAETATLLANQTLLGAARLLDESDEPAEELRRQVTSPAGTTHAAIESFKKDGLSEIVSRAVEACKKRSIELSNLD
jgi:pyrroline-5-carboxylate reductase